MLATAFGLTDSLVSLVNDWVANYVTADYIHAVCAHHISTVLTVGQTFV